MAFSLTSEKRVSRSEEIKTTPSVDSKGALAVTDASTAEAAPSAKPIASDAAARVAVSARSEFVLAKCMPIYWEEKVSEPVDLFDKDGTKTGYKIVTTGAGYTITNIYNLAGRLATTEYQSMYGDWSATLYEYSIISEDGQQQNRVTSSGKSGEYTWSSYEISDTENNLLESRFENSDGYKSSTTQTYSKAADGSIEKIVVKSTGSGSTYTYVSYAEYDATWNLLKSAYSDGNGYSSSTERIAIVDAAGSIEAYSITSKGFGAGGYWYESTETLDKNNNLIANTYKDSSGYFSQRTSSRQEDPDRGEVIVTKDISGNDDGTEKASYTSTAKYTLDWRTIESEHSDANGYSSKLTTSIKINPSGEKIYSQTYQFKYLDSITSEWTTEYNEQWWPIVDGKPVEQPPVLWKTPVAADAPPPKTIPVVEKSAVDDFQTTAKSSSDTVSEKAITGVAGQSDKLKGSAGDDVFIVNDRADKIVSGQKGNSDSVMSEKFSLDLRASKWDGIEHAMLTGSENLNLVGDAGSNLLSGNGANNVLRGGAGADTLFGGGGDDVFVIAKEKTVDTIIDFVPGADKIALSGSYFKSLFDKSMHLKDGVIGERLILDSQGSIWFDIDGAGRKSPVQIAIVGGVNNLDKADFIYLL